MRSAKARKLGFSGHLDMEMARGRMGCVCAAGKVQGEKKGVNAPAMTPASMLSSVLSALLDPCGRDVRMAARERS